MAEVELKQVLGPGDEVATFTAADRDFILGHTGCRVSVRARGGGPRVLSVKGPVELVVSARQLALAVLRGWA